jgi:hypothetical protein
VCHYCSNLVKNSRLILYPIVTVQTGKNWCASYNVFFDTLSFYSKYIYNLHINIALIHISTTSFYAGGGPRSPSCTLDRLLIPPSAWAEIFRPKCAQSHLETYPPTLQNSYPKFWNHRTTFENTPICLPKYSIARGEGVFPDLFEGVESSYF